MEENNLSFYDVGFKRFVKNCFNSCVQALNLECQTELADYDKLNEKLNLNEKQTRARIEHKIDNIWLTARTKLMQILIKSYGKAQASSDKNLFLLALSSIVNVTSEYVLEHQQLKDNEAILVNQRKWTEVLVDFILNIKENTTATETEYISSFNYNQHYSIDELKFLFQLYQTSTTTILYFLSSILHASCIRLKISSYLIKYVHTTHSNLITQLSHSENEPSHDCMLQAASKYIQMQIKLTNSSSEFDLSQNKNINVFIKCLLDRFFYLTSSLDDGTRPQTDKLIESYLDALVECLNCLYDEESAYYDEENILETLLDSLDKVYLIGSNSNSSRFDLSKVANVVKSMVNLTCVAYKSNIINNDKIVRLYEYLNKVN